MKWLHWFGLGKLPLEADQLILPSDRKLVCEHVWCSITFRDFRSSRRVCNWKRQWFAGSIVVSDHHIAAFRGRNRLINTSFGDPRFSGLSFVADETSLAVSHDAGLYRADWSGKLEYRFGTSAGAEVLKLVS